MSKNENESENETPFKEGTFLAPESVKYVLCPECYGEMPRQTAVCPHCGAAHNADKHSDDADTKPKNKIVHIIWIVLIGLGAAAILGGFLIDFTGQGMIVGGFLLLAASLIRRFV